MTTATFSATCVCGRTRAPQPVDLHNAWSLLAVAADAAAEGWRHDAQGRRLCPDCGDEAGIPCEPMFVAPPRPEECADRCA